SPRDLQLAEVAGVDLIERRVLAASEIGGVHRPLAVLGTRLPGCLAGHAWLHPGQSSAEQNQRRHCTGQQKRHAASVRESNSGANHKSDPVSWFFVLRSGFSFLVPCSGLTPENPQLAPST